MYYIIIIIDNSKRNINDIFAYSFQYFKNLFWLIVLFWQPPPQAINRGFRKYSGHPHSCRYIEKKNNTFR